MRPSIFIEPEQSARMKKWRGRREMPPPGMIVMLSVIARFAQCRHRAPSVEGAQNIPAAGSALSVIWDGVMVIGR
jgi:hypothetical protein